MTSERKPSDKSFTVKLNGCARCGKNHRAVTFRKLTRPMDDCSHWGSCPTNGQPIMLFFTND